jgi:hypothetical protein
MRVWWQKATTTSKGNYIGGIAPAATSRHALRKGGGVGARRVARGPTTLKRIGEKKEGINN